MPYFQLQSGDNTGGEDESVADDTLQEICGGDKEEDELLMREEFI
ncbi:hypothetical protein ACP70R_012681 [Stipagrostis hirtigluma subsp. patula]